ncbi:hypothetical protein JCM10908_002430 [Rhodotorula pacifica]|uniref:uncharacterized protein n=1 Tax=Rhodotorula pacifica TaxID=1495444 RepID=UPI00316CB432
MYTPRGSGETTPTTTTTTAPAYDDDLAPELDLLALQGHNHFTHAAPSYSRQLGDFPPEIVALIVHHLYYDYVPLPHPFPNPDPFISLEPPSSTYPAPHLAPSLDAQAKELLAGLCLVDKTWSAEATRALWRRVSFGMPRAFESVLRTIEEYSGGQRVARPLRSDHSRRSGSTDSEGSPSSSGLGRRASQRGGGGGSSLGLTMTATADLPDAPAAPPAPVHVAQTWADSPTPRLAKAVEPAKTDPAQDYFGAGAHPPQLLPTLDPAESPLLFTRAISFARFRTAGMKRTLRQGSNERFVTPQRLLTLLQGTRYPRKKLAKPITATKKGAAAEELSSEESEEDESLDSSTEDEDGVGVRTAGGKKKKDAGQLCQVGFTEYMDSAITREVLEEMLFRGGYLAEYEEPDEPAFPQFDPHSSESDLGASLSPTPFHHPTAMGGLQPPVSPLEPFHYRDLGSSHSRSPSSDRGHLLPEEVGTGRRRSASITTSIAEEDETMVDTDEEVFGSGAQTPVGRRPAVWMQRRPSGSAYMPSVAAPPSEDDFSSGNEHERDEEDGDEEDHRGRERYGRGRGVPQLGSPPTFRGRGRFQHLGVSSPGSNSSSMPPPLVRSSSLPAHSLPQVPRSAHRRPLRQVSLSRASERSSSVPASVAGRWQAEPQPKRTVQVLEGSLTMQPLRGLDLCGCVSRVFIAALEDLARTYKLGPPALMPPPSPTAGLMESLAEVDNEDPEADTDMGTRTPSVRSMRLGYGIEERVLNRTFFPHLRRLGLASALLPSHLLSAFVLSFPYLTHLDLGSTLTTPSLLKGLALAGQKGIGGRPMRLKSLSIARCRLVTAASILGLMCGDCPPLTTLAGLTDDDDESWGSGEVVSELVDLSLFGDRTYPSPLESPELRLIVSASPAFRSGRLRTLDLSSTPMTDQILSELVPAQPHLLELGLAHCRSLTMQAVATFLCDKAPGVEVLDLSYSCPSTVGQGISSRRRVTLGQPTISIMELHAILLSQCASLESSSANPEEAQLFLAFRATNLRVVELDEKSLELVQGGAGDWKPIWGKGRRGWYVDTATTSHLTPSHSPLSRPRQLVHLGRDHPQRLGLLHLAKQPGAGIFEIGWLARKFEVMKGEGMMGSREGLFAFHAFG